MKELSCHFCLQVFLFSTYFYVSNSNTWERMLPGAPASSPPITTNVTSLFFFIQFLSFYLSFSDLTAPQDPLPLLCLSLSASLAFCPQAEVEYMESQKTQIYATSLSHHPNTLVWAFVRPGQFKPPGCWRNVSI